MEIEAERGKIIFIVGPPRSGTTLLYETIATSLRVASQSKENHDVWEGICHPSNWDYESNHIPDTFKFNEKFEAQKIKSMLTRRSFVLSDSVLFKQYLRLRSKRIFRRLLLVLIRLEALFRSTNDQCIIEKTPRNALRLEVLHKMFPNSGFIFITDNEARNVERVKKAWNTKTPILEKFIFGERFTRASYKRSHYEVLSRWKFVLPKGWKDVQNDIDAISKLQVTQCVREILKFQALYKEISLHISLEEFVKDKDGFLQKVSSKFNLELLSIQESLPEINRL